MQKHNACRGLAGSLIFFAALLPSALGQGTVAPVDPKVDHIRGDFTAPITFIEYGD